MLRIGITGPMGAGFIIVSYLNINTNNANLQKAMPGM